jgi:hypothetical protein
MILRPVASQLRSAQLEEQLAASREECAAISQGLVEALSTLSHRASRDLPSSCPAADLSHPAAAADDSTSLAVDALRKECAALSEQLLEQREQLDEAQINLASTQEHAAALAQVIKYFG